MESILIVVVAFIGYLVAYNTYGRYLSQKVFGLDAGNRTPSHELADGVDYVPTKKQVIFGHHFTSIAGTGPIVGPAIGIIWGWVPALLWIFIGSIFMGAVHDFGALVISLRHKGHTMAEITGMVMNRRMKIMFFIIVFLALLIVIAIFGMVVSALFIFYIAVTAGLGPAMLLGLLVAGGVASGVTTPSRDMLVRAAAPKGASGRVFGFVYSGLDLGSALVPLLLGWAMDQGYPAAVFYATAGFLAVTALTVMQVRRQVVTAEDPA